MIVVHGHEICLALPFNAGLATEEGAEHNNKHIRYYRDHHSVTTCPAENLKSFFLRQTYISDPKINYEIYKIVKANRKPRRDLPDRVKMILKNPAQQFDIVEEGVEFDASIIDEIGPQGDPEILPESDDLHIMDDLPELIPDDEVPGNPFEQGLLFEENENDVEIVAVTDFVDDFYSYFDDDRYR